MNWHDHTTNIDVPDCNGIMLPMRFIQPSFWLKFKLLFFGDRRSPDAKGIQHRSEVRHWENKNYRIFIKQFVDGAGI